MIIDLYPEILCRIGTLPYDLLESIRWSENELLGVDLLIYKTLKEQAFNYPGSPKELRAFQQKIKQFESSFKEKYIKQQQLHRAAFHALSGNPMLQKGLLQSSPSLWESIQRYRLQNPSIYRKKERQTERAMAQYLARICTKTSPFSTFTALSLNDLTGKNIVPKDSKTRGVVRINNYVLAQVEELLAAYPPVYCQLAVRVNPTLNLVGEEYVFLLNSRNIESVQRMEQNGVLGLILEIFQQDNYKLPLFGALCQSLSEKVEASKEELEVYLFELIRFGFLNWVWPVSGTDVNWINGLIQWLDSINDFAIKNQLIAVFQQLQTTANQLPNLDTAKRWPLMQDCLNKLTSCLQKISEQIPNDQVSDNEAFKSFNSTGLSLRAEQLFFEDSHLAAEMNWSEQDLKKSIQELAEVVELLIPLRYYPEKDEPYDFFKQHYQPGAKVPLMQFYEDFYRGKRQETDSQVIPEEQSDSSVGLLLTDEVASADQSLKSPVLQWREKIVKELLKHIIIKSNFNVHLPVSLLSTVITPTTKRAAVSPSPESFGALLQLQKSSTGQYKSYVDAVFTGYGKMLGRFLHLFPEKHTTQVQQWVDELKGTALWVDNTDASFHNANAHPQLLKKKVSVPGGQQYNYNIGQYPPDSFEEENKIALSDLIVSFSESKNKLLLHCSVNADGKDKGEEVTIFNFGLEALQTRSPMYRLLSTFCTMQPDVDPLKDILSKATRQDKKGWIHLPRVYIGDHLIFQRRAWYIPKMDLPLRKKGESEAAYFLRVNHWRGQCELPEVVFITLSPVELGLNAKKDNNRNTDAYKPQYIDFSVPALMSHFGREMSKVNAMLKVEEMLPGVGEMVEVNGRERAVEVMVQFLSA